MSYGYAAVEELLPGFTSTKVADQITVNPIC